MTPLGRVVEVAQWVVGVGALAAAVMLFTLEGAPDESTPLLVGEVERQISEGSEVYAARCATCHGREGQGGQGPRLAGTVLVNYPDVAEQIDVIANGGSGMPAFSGDLTDEEIAAVTAFTRFGLP